MSGRGPVEAEPILFERPAPSMRRTRRSAPRVLSIAHSAVRHAAGRLRYERLAELADVELTLVVPDRWWAYGAPLACDPPASEGIDIRIEPVRLRHVPRIGWYLHYYPRLGPLIEALRPDVIHLWEEPWSLVALQAARLRDRIVPEAALVLETDQNILRRLPPPFEWIRRTTLRRTDLLIGRQEESLDVCRACGFAGPTRIVEYAVDGAIFRPLDRTTASAAREFTLGYVGRIVREKGLHDVLEALAMCAAPVSLCVLGSGPDTVPLTARAAELGLGARLRLLDPRSPAGVAEFMNGLDALVLLSRTTATWKEQFGRVIMEAQACGVPVIGSDSGAIPGVVAEGGWIVGEGDAAALSRLLDRLAGDPAEVARRGAAGLAQARDRFSVDTVARGLDDAFVAASRHRRQLRAAGMGARADD